jgi:hypothetical protein
MLASILFQAVEGAARVLGCDSEAGERIGRISKLIEGFETPYGMELPGQCPLGLPRGPRGGE